MGKELAKYAVAIFAAALSSYVAIRSDLVELKTTVNFHTSQIDRIQSKLDK